MAKEVQHGELVEEMAEEHEEFDEDQIEAALEDLDSMRPDY
jgi:uncharacterized protein (DUF433 family)